MSDVVHRVYYVAAIRERNEARAELEKTTGLLGLRALRYTEVVAELGALRAAVAEHDKHCRCTWFASYPPPSAAPAASEPKL